MKLTTPVVSLFLITQMANASDQRCVAVLLRPFDWLRLEGGSPGTRLVIRFLIASLRRTSLSSSAIWSCSGPT